MPRLVFQSVEEFNRWVKDFVKTDRYATYITKNEVIIVPLVSTQPITFAYIEMNNAQALGSIKQNLPNGIKIYSLESFDWRWEDREVRERRFLEV